MRIAEGEEHLDREVLCHQVLHDIAQQVLNILKEVHVLVYQINIDHMLLD